MTGLFVPVTMLPGVFPGFFFGVCMAGRSVNKSASVGKFRRQVSKTKSINVSPMVMRGGIRL